MAIPRYKRRKRILGEEFEREWYEDDLNELKEMYEQGIPLTMMADSFGKKCLEVGIAIAILAELGEIEPRPSGVFGRDIRECN